MESVKNIKDTAKAIVEDIEKISTAESLESLNTLNRDIRLAMNAMMVHLDKVYKDSQHLTNQRRAELNDRPYKDK